MTTASLNVRLNPLSMTCCALVRSTLNSGHCKPKRPSETFVNYLLRTCLISLFSKCVVEWEWLYCVAARKKRLGASPPENSFWWLIDYFRSFLKLSSLWGSRPENFVGSFLHFVYFIVYLTLIFDKGVSGITPDFFKVLHAFVYILLIIYHYLYRKGESTKSPQKIVYTSA